MLTPRYFFIDDFKQFYTYFNSKLHRQKHFDKDTYLWTIGKPYDKIYYISSGIAKTYIEHENGHRKIISFHSNNTIFPGYHRREFKIESSIATKAVTDITALEFTREQFGEMILENSALNLQLTNWYATYVNLLLYENAHQGYNTTFIKLCNLLYLLNNNQNPNPAHTNNILEFKQDDIAEILGLSRVNLARSFAKLRDENIIRTSRQKIEIIAPDILTKYCSLETI